MKVKNIMKSNVVTTDLDESISSVLSKMKKHGVHQLPVLHNGILHGIVELKSIVTKNLDVESAKAESVKINVSSLNKEDDADEAVRKFLQSGFRALPVVDSNRLVGIVSETDFLKVPSLFDGKKSVENVMSECSFVGTKDALGKIKKLMLYENVSRLPVLDNGKLVGTIGVLEMIKAANINRTMSGKGGRLQERGAKEKLSSENLPAESIMRKPVIVSSETTLAKAAELLLSCEELYAEKNGKTYIITPKDILETIKREGKGVLVDITNIADEDEYTLEKMHQAAAETVKKVGKFIDGIDSLILRIERMHKSGEKTKYSVRTRFFTPLGLFVSHAWGWDLVSVTQECLNKLETEIKKVREKHLAQKKHGRQKSRL